MPEKKKRTVSGVDALSTKMSADAEARARSILEATEKEQ